MIDDEAIDYEDMDDLPLSDHIEWHHYSSEEKTLGSGACEAEWFSV